MKKAHIKIVGDWSVEVVVNADAGQEIRAVVEIPPPVATKVLNEPYDELPECNPANLAKWLYGAPLRGVRAQECTTCFSLAPETIKVVSADSPDAMVFKRGQDYELQQDWGSVGRLPQGRIKPGQSVLISYDYYEQRLDSIVRSASGEAELRIGVPHIATPLPPKLPKGEIRLANIFIPNNITKLDADNLYPILETAYPEPPKSSPTPAERLLPKSMEKLKNGGVLKILAWGDSVTDGTFLEDVEKERWQSQFVARLGGRFSQARIELATEAWGGRTTMHYLAEPPGSIHNYQEKVLDARPDLIVMEFVNDADLHEEALEAQYGRLLMDIRGMGAEWIIITPHYIRPDWMGLDRQKDVDEDPRPYVKSLRGFAAKHQIPLAEGALRYGRLWRQGIPFNTLMRNNINHPDGRGMAIFADSLMELFP